MLEKLNYVWIIAIVAFILLAWTLIARHLKLDDIYSIIVNTAFLLICSIATHKSGQEDVRKELKTHARTQYRHSKTVFDGMATLLNENSMNIMPPNPIPSVRQQAEYERAQGIKDKLTAQTAIWARLVGNSMEFWEDFAIENLGGDKQRTDPPKTQGDNNG